MWMPSLGRGDRELSPEGVGEARSEEGGLPRVRDLGGWSTRPLTLAFRWLSFHDTSISLDRSVFLSL